MRIANKVSVNELVYADEFTGMTSTVLEQINGE